MSKTSHDLNLVCNAGKWDIQMNSQTNLLPEEYANIEQESCFSLMLREESGKASSEEVSFELKYEGWIGVAR